MKLRRTRHTAWRKIADETVLLDLEGKRMYGLNPTAAFVWQTLEAFDGPDAMLRALGASEPAPLSRAELEAFLRQLEDLGLVTAADGRRPGDPEAGDPEAGGPAAGPVPVEPPAESEPPRILWQEKVEQIAATCAFLPAQNPLCGQAPFS